MARVYRPSVSEKGPFQTELISRFIQIEIVVGGMLSLVGGFYLRATDDYRLVIVGFSFLLLGLFRLSQRYNRLRESPGGNDGDRVLRRLKNGLSAEYTIAVDYPVQSDTRIDYLLLGPPGIMVLSAFTESGYIVGDRTTAEWTVKEEADTDDGRTVPNPIKSNQLTIRALEERLRNSDHILQDDPKNIIILMYNGSEGPVTEYDEVRRLGEAVRFIKSMEDNHSQYNWESIDELEDVLGLSEYS